jgi:hypothetical protein
MKWRIKETNPGVFKIQCKIWFKWFPAEGRSYHTSLADARMALRFLQEAHDWVPRVYDEQ